jgi:hypothetical protein
MATSLKKLTGVGGDVRKLARLLQAKAPEGHMLAYINPREAALLKAHGGSGEIHEDTGIPSFEDGEETTVEMVQPQLDSSFAQYEQGAAPAAETAISADPSQYQISAPAGGSYGLQAKPTSAGAGLTPSGPVVSPEISIPTSPRYAVDSGKALSELTAQAPAAPKGGISNETMAKLGLTGLQGILGARAAGAARQEGQQAKTETQALAVPYQQKGQQLQAQAQRGELTPQAMQSLQAVQAQTAQGAEKRGGVGAAQAAQQVEAFRQQLLAQQYDYGLKLSGIGDQIALGAIKTGMQADQAANTLTSNYFNNIARTVYGQTAAA